MGILKWFKSSSTDRQEKKLDTLLQRTEKLPDTLESVQMSQAHTMHRTDRLVESVKKLADSLAALEEQQKEILRRIEAVEVLAKRDSKS